MGNGHSVMGAVGQHVGDTWEWNLPALWRKRLSVFDTRVGSPSFGRSGLGGSPVSRQAWNLGQSVLKSGRSGGLRNEDRHCVSINMGK